MLPKRLTVTSLQNPRIKSIARLHDRRERRETGLMLVEGFHELSLAWQAGLRLRSLVLCPELLGREAGETALLDQINTSGAEILEVNRAVMEKLAYREHPDAWLGIAPCPAMDLAGLGRILDSRPGKAPLLVLAENLEKPGNLGAILRSADAAGADGVLVCQGRTDVFNPNVVRSGKGSLFALPVVECSNAEADAWLAGRGIAVFAASPEGQAGYWQTDLAVPAALAVGAEKEGLSEFWMTGQRTLVSIPMYGRVNSLNVAQAATLLLYEAARQRQART